MGNNTTNKTIIMRHTVFMMMINNTKNRNKKDKDKKYR